MIGGADVVVVADFEGASAPRFELHCLLFLAAWMAHRGDSRDWPLHLACVGEPPRSVRLLADRVGASITVHPPLVFNALRTSNKLRAFDVRPQTPLLLMLDADVLVLDDLSPLVALAGDGVGVSMATVNHLSEHTWQQIYQAAGVPYPGPTGTCWCADPALASLRGLTEEQVARCRRMPPFFNSGVVVAPWALDLGTRWRSHLERIVAHFDASPDLWTEPGRLPDDEHALATAVERMRREGARVVAVPWRYHARPLLFRAGAVRRQDVALFHYHNALKPYARSVPEVERFLFGDRMRGARRWAARLLELRAARSPVYRRVPPRDLEALGWFYELVQRLLPVAVGSEATCPGR